MKNNKTVTGQRKASMQTFPNPVQSGRPIVSKGQIRIPELPVCSDSPPLSLHVMISRTFLLEIYSESPRPIHHENCDKNMPMAGSFSNAMSFRPRLIINADRLGLDSWTNDRVFEAFENGWISSASIMVNTPGYAQALGVIHERKLAHRIGLHAALDIGTPLSAAMKSVVSSDTVSRQRKLLANDPAATAAVAEELAAQIATARGDGLPITHIDSYRHMHTHWSVIPEFISVAVDAGIPAMRLAGNFLFPSSMQRRVYCRVVNRRIRAAGFVTAQKFSYLNRYLASEPGVDGGMVMELMVRPGIDDEFQLFKTSAFARLLDNFRLVSYEELAGENPLLLIS